MTQGLLWLPLLLFFVLLTALGWLERRRQGLFRTWATGSELAKLDGQGAARLKDGLLSWASFEAGKLNPQGEFRVRQLELLELLALDTGEAPLTEESQGQCRIRLVGAGQQADVPFADADRARLWMDELMARCRCDL
ncbi:hypothetical protein EVJ50_14375 [Synechococcus sp. RSCCF101]|uniref:hypothetical protein n=1 Tax=Synechococcus sp. RSCCF101 TaxID=2511069 RepID=UPI0012455F58|nr:hypothetical protein [Synechococcus sp. RSCCF101]QEY30889.1 hypothetical protein EVJ50_00065 [Synechococcus sp. RSCCF101]QEY33243.1 hypothetical protein EVJ50_14375 [Synechococcus sp. RSCCF101]